MNDYAWEELKVGMEESFEVLIDQEKMDFFVKITGDVNPLHNDENFAREKGFPTKVCFGMLTSSLLSTLAGVYLPGERSLIQAVEVKLVKPVFMGDCLTVKGMIQELNDTVQQMVLKVMIMNQKGEKVLRGKMKVGLLNE